MPFKSEKQRRYMWSQHPDIARRWTNEMKSKGKPVTKKSKGKKDSSACSQGSMERRMKNLIGGKG